MPVVRAARRALPLALLLALTLPAGAHAAATMSVSGPTPPRTLTFTASDGIDHETVPYLASNGNLRIEDADGISIGASGCTSVDADTVDCGAASGYTRVSFGFGAGSDALSVSGALGLPLTVDGGAGDDEIDAGERDDMLEGGDGNDTIYAGAGADDVRGGAGSDELSGGIGADTIDGGSGDDYVGAWDEQAEAAPVTCGPGDDNVDFDYGLDTVAADCEHLPPHLDAAPTISGEPTVGTTLTRSTPPASAGTATESYTYWARCDPSGWPCHDIDDAHAASYTLTVDDLGYRIQVIYYLGNSAGYDGRASALTAVVRLAEPPPAPIALPPAPGPALPVSQPAPKAFAVAGAPGVTMHGATATVDTGRTVACPAGAIACQLSATARPGGSSARVRGRPAVAGTARIRVRAGASAKIAIRLTPKAVRMLRGRHRITLVVSAVLKRGPVQHATTSFVVTVKVPARRRR
jgi:hypothetical protein